MRERERGRKSGFAKCEKRQMRDKNKKEGIEKRVESRKTRLRMSGWTWEGKKNCGTERTEPKSKTRENARNGRTRNRSGRAIGKDKFDNKKETRDRREARSDAESKREKNWRTRSGCVAAFARVYKNFEWRKESRRSRGTR